MRKPKLIGSLKYRKLRYTKNHPLRIPRVSLLLEFLEALDLISAEEKVEGRPATDDELTLFHTQDYIETLKEADRCMCVPKGAREKYNIGSYENPVSPAMFRGSVLATGSSIQAVDLYLEGFSAFNPAGGMHHAYPNRANGFCFINDPAIALKYLLKKGFKRILYVDIDAHHCDGVQDAFYEDDRVFVLSFHQSPEYAFPFKKGFLEERGSGRGKGYNLNVPMPKGVHDDEFLYLYEDILGEVADSFKPEVYILQLGTDPLEEDPLSKFRLSNLGFLEIFKRTRQILGEGIYLGGGGYHPLALARAWTLVWCEMSKRKAPEFLPQQAKEVLLSVEWEEYDDEERNYLYETLKDPWRGGPIRGEIKKLKEKVLSNLK